jgi:hypothetical protein
MLLVLDENNIVHADTVMVPSTTIVYMNGTSYFEKNSANHVLMSSPDPEVVISDAIKRAGNIYIAAGRYDLSNGFTGFVVPSNTQINLDSNTMLRVASGYQGYVFKINGSSIFSTIQGGQVAEVRPVQRQWTGIILQAGNPPTAWNTINNIQIEDPHVGILFSGTHNNFATTNLISNTMIDRPVRGIDFNYTNYVCCTQDGFNYNTFYKVDIQSSANTLVGFNNIGNARNEFYDSKVWDAVPGTIETRVDATSTSTLIFGGKMTEPGKFIDLGTNTLVYDSISGTRSIHYSGNSTWSANSKLTFTPNSNLAGINIGCTASAPSNLTDGDIWCDDASNSLKTRIGGAILTVIMGSNSNTFSKTNTFEGTLNAEGAVKVHANKLLIRNPDSTFTTSIQNSAQTKNNTVTIPLFSGAQTFALVPEFSSTTGEQNGNGTGTTSFSPVMDGVYATLTPKISGNATITVSGDAQNSVAGDGCRIDVRYSDGAMGANGDVPTGQLVGANIKTSSATENQTIPWFRSADVTGLTAGTKYYFDLTQAAVTGGTCTITNVYWEIHEY